jgi:hypothetical protein
MKKKHKEEIPEDDTSKPYEVGYGKPPKHTRFQHGRSGNPKGRPKGHQNAKTLFKQTLNEKVIIREGERTRRISKLEAFLRRTVNEALQGDAKKASTLISLSREMGVFSEGEEATAFRLTSEDDAIIAAFVESLGHDTEAHAPAPSEDSDAPSDDREGDT